METKSEIKRGSVSTPALSVLEKALLTLQRGSLKRTQPREAILKFLIEEHGPFTIDEVHRSLQKQKLDPVTVYRVLAAFERIGLARRCDFGDGTARYELQLDPEDHHHHVICTHCRRTENLDHCKLQTLEAQVRKLGFRQIRHSLEFFGLCSLCAEKTS